MHNLVILGASGSIGQSTLKVLRHNPVALAVLALDGGSQRGCHAARLSRILPVSPSWWTKAPPVYLAGRLQGYGSATRVLSGQAALCGGVPEAHSVMAAIVGAGGSGAHHGHRCAPASRILANRRRWSCRAPSLWRRCASTWRRVLPIDSEHNAIFQCLPRPSSASRVCDLAAAGISRSC